MISLVKQIKEHKETMEQRLENLRSDIRREQIQRLFRQGGSHEIVRERVEQYLQAA